MPASPDDPYELLLGLGEGKRPPHYYDLLRLELFCSHPERIEHAVRKQFRRIKPFQDHVDHSIREAVQDIMNRIATAHVVLTDADKKDAYDAALAEELGVDRDAVVHSRAAAPLPEYELLVSVGPSLVGTRVPLIRDTVLTLGSDPECAVSLESSRVAPLHCRFRYEDGDWICQQMDPSRPVLVNDLRTAELVLTKGDAVDVGGFRLRFARIADSSDRVTTTSLPPLSLTLQAGPSVPDPHCHALPPERILIGHCDTALWQLGDPLISRHHCRIEPHGEDWTVVDLQSTNGTFVNGRRVTKARALHHRDVIAIGRFEVRVNFRR
jgi:hypothetical protein